MGTKLFTILTICCILVAIANARQVPRQRQRVHGSHGSHGSQRAVIGRPSAPQGRLFPGTTIAIKKLVLLKFKKIVPISLILLKSSNDNEAELVPVYPTDQIPENVQFIPTPNGISGHKDVQAIAIPKELHEQLQLSGLSNVEDIESLLQTNSIAGEAASATEDAQNSGAVASTIAVPQMEVEDTPLNMAENDEDQLLEGASMTQEAPMSPPVAATNLRRVPIDELLRSGIRNSVQQQQTSVEEVPLILYTAAEGGPYAHGAAGQFSGRRYVAATPAAVAAAAGNAPAAPRRRHRNRGHRYQQQYQ